MQRSLQIAADVIRQATNLVVLTGAGMSQEAGIPDFRSREGWWKQVDPRQVATIDALDRNYSLFHQFYATRIQQRLNVEPHAGHRILARWEEVGKVTSVVTQNVDRMHQQAGSRNVLELHGTILEYRCHQCGRPGERHQFLEGNPCVCNGKWRPNVVLFGEQLPQYVWERAVVALEQADAVLVIGTSLQVAPVNQLPSMTGGKRILLNKELTGAESLFDCVIQNNTREGLRQLDRILVNK